MGGRLNGQTIKKMNQIRNIKYNMMEQGNVTERKPTPGARQKVIIMVKEGKRWSEIRQAFPTYDDRIIKTWIEEELSTEEVEKLIKADIVEDVIKNAIKERIKMYIDKAFEKEKIPYYIANSKVIVEYTNFKTREDLEAYIKQIMDEETKKQEESEER